ncbi:pitrilysin family protein [Candidatus Kapabacteria bacterium]|nr:pitrilysin family protein [Candidatus Kapabacteria bacterium]
MKLSLIITLFTMSLNLTAKDIVFVEETLDNGLQVIYHIDKTAPVVSTVVHYKVGSKDEDKDKTGYAHFFEHLMFEATDSIPRSEIAKYINEAGGWLNAHTSFDETVYKFKVPSNEIQLPLWIESQRMRGLQVEKTGVETQRGVVLEEKNARVDNQPYGTMLEKMLSNLFIGGAYSWATIGDADHIRNATIKNFKDFYDNFYKPKNAILVISGNFEYQTTKEYVAKYFGGITNSDLPVRNNIEVVPFNKDYTESIIDDKAPLKAVFMGYRGPKLGSDDYYSMNLLANILAAGESSRLYRKLVDKEQIAVQASMMPLSLEADGGIIFYAVASGDTELEILKEEIEEEIEKIAEKGISNKELEKTKNITEIDLLTSNKDVLEKAMSLARYKAYYDDPELINSEIKKYNSITTDDIVNVAKKYLINKNKVVLNYLPKK